MISDAGDKALSKKITELKNKNKDNPNALRDLDEIARVLATHSYCQY